MAAKRAKMCFGAELRRLRLQAGMSLRLLARRCSISPVYLSDIENSRKPAPSVEILHTLIRVLHADGDALMSLAVKSVEQYGGTARKPRLPDTLSADEYLLVMKKKQTLQPDEFQQWLQSTALATESREERKVRKYIRSVVETNLLHEQPLVLEFGDVASSTNSGGNFFSDNGKPCISIRRYEGQSEKEAVAIYIDTCYREWCSIRNPRVRELYLETLQHAIYSLCYVALRSHTTEHILA